MNSVSPSLEATLTFLGDVMLGRLVNERLKTAPPEYVFGDTLPILKLATALFANLECAVTDFGEPIPQKTFCFRTDSKNVKVLRLANVTAVSLANNHILDYEGKGLLETLRNLRKAKIAFAGAGKTAKEAQKPAIAKASDLRIALIAATDNEPEWEATDKKPGVFYIPIDFRDGRFKNLVSSISAGRRRADIVIVSLHWGPNWGYEPPGQHQFLAHCLIDQGADIIFGHSPHVFRGIQIYKGRPILYSCADFIDDYAVSEVERNDESFIFQVYVSNKKITKVVLIPTIIENFKANLARGAQKDEIMEKMARLCERLGTKAVKTTEGLTISVREAYSR